MVNSSDSLAFPFHYLIENISPSTLSECFLFFSSTWIPFICYRTTTCSFVYIYNIQKHSHTHTTHQSSFQFITVDRFFSCFIYSTANIDMTWKYNSINYFLFNWNAFFLHHLLQCNLLRCFEDSIHLYVLYNKYRALNVVVRNSENSVNVFVHWNHVFVEEVSECVCAQFDVYTNTVLLSFLSISSCRFFSVKYGDSRIVHIRLHLHHIFKSHVVNQITTTFVNYCKLHCLSCPFTYTILKLY